jgi:hypothetical protein
MSQKMVTTNEARAMLARRGVDVPYATLARWVLRGLFAGAKSIETPRGNVWMIPASAIERFEKPKIGRPKEEKESRASKRASKRSAS